MSLSMSTDAKGRVTRAEADFSALLGKKDSALDEVTGLRAVLQVSGFGKSVPVIAGSLGADARRQGGRHNGR